MKPYSLTVAAVLIALASGAAWRVAAQQPLPGGMTLPAGDPLVEWQYPNAAIHETTGIGQPAVPLHGINSRAADTLETVYHYYQKKCEPHFVANEGNAWQRAMQPAMLMNQFTQGGSSAGFLYSPRKDADSALMIVHQPKRTLTIQLSRDPQDKSRTDILLVADDH